MLSEHFSSKCWGWNAFLSQLHRKWGLRFVFPDLFYGWMEGEGREEGTWQQMNASNIWEGAERSAGPEGKVFVQELR